VNKTTDIYLTIDAISEGFYKEKGSKFLAFALPCDSKLTAKAHLDDFRNKHPQAVHVCFAWRFGFDKYEDRYSDDGEPNNAAGKPIFGQIQAFGITNVLIAIVRYYGGTNLGVGGLVNAYKTAAKDALEQATIIEKEITQSFELTYNYEETGIVMLQLNRMHATIVQQYTKGDLPCIDFTLKRSLVHEIDHYFEMSKTVQIKEKTN